MDQFFVPLLLLEEGTIIGIGLLLIIAGGFLASRIFDVQITLRRIGYLWFIALAGLALTITQFLWILTPAAADAGLLSVLVIAGMGSLALFGAAIYYGSAARSRHIHGETSSAWLGFVPLANLWLMFKGTENKPAEGAERGPFSRYVLDPVLVFGAILVLALSQGIDKAMENTPLYATTDSQALRNLMAESQTLEESFATEARLSSADLPIQIDDITTLSAISAEGRTLRITYDISQDIQGLNPGFKATLAHAQCAPEMFGPDIKRGGTVEMIYRAPSGRVIETYRITAADCGP